MYDIIIIGGGVAGLTAGIYAGRAGMRTLLIEKISPGGQAATAGLIENYPGFPEPISGMELTDRMSRQAEKFGMEKVEGEVIGLKLRETEEEVSSVNAGRKLVRTQNREYETLTVIVATGAEPKKLGVPGEEEFRGKGVSYCATCDGPLFRAQEIVMVGGGDTAVEEALFLTKFAKKVILVHRRDRLRATKLLQERALSNEKMELIWNCVVTEILGEDKVKGVRVKNRRSGEEKDISIQGVFISVGIKPGTAFLHSLVDMDEEGYIITDEKMKTSADGIYAGGDCRKKLLRQIVTACGEGATAAVAAQHYVEELKGTAYGD
ncbi:thioredoxin-disulfide reductase [candidate division NPL-UPA2 bacterium]|nr:thioredoxin-disulfide reductase [candidate division NPL-UPA2 bacterium]